MLPVLRFKHILATDSPSPARVPQINLMFLSRCRASVVCQISGLAVIESAA